MQTVVSCGPLVIIKPTESSVKELTMYIYVCSHSYVSTYMSNTYLAIKQFFNASKYSQYVVIHVRYIHLYISVLT